MLIYTAQIAVSWAPAGLKKVTFLLTRQSKMTVLLGMPSSPHPNKNNQLLMKKKRKEKVKG